MKWWAQKKPLQWRGQKVMSDEQSSVKLDPLGGIAILNIIESKGLITDDQLVFAGEV